jgi:DNA polymerase (family 10)
MFKGVGGNVTLDRKTAVQTLGEIAKLLEVRGENVHRVRAFANASRVVERVGGDLGSMIESGEILKLKGIGRGTAAVLAELAGGRRPQALKELYDAIPEGVREMLTIPGLGPKKVGSLWRDLGLSSIGELEYACRENRLVDLKGFGSRTQEAVLGAIRFARRSGERRLISEAWATLTLLEGSLKTSSGVDSVMVAGEPRRFSETVGVLDLVIAAADETVAIKALKAEIPGMERVGPGQWAGDSEDGLTLRARVVPRTEAAAALLWSTGSDDHIEALVSRAKNLGFDLREDGLWRDDERVECADERAIYQALGCQWVPPELREGGTEIDLAAAGTLPDLVRPEDLLGALHNHSTDSDGSAPLEQMADAARQRGWSFFGVADHSPAAFYANGVDAPRLRDQWRRIDDFNRGGSGIRVVKGLEADVLTDGALDIPEGCEGGLEYVVASVHSVFRMSEEQQTDRVVKAVSHPACRVLGHPTGRLLLVRPGYSLDLERVLQACAEHGVAVEINASPYRLDLDWWWATRALELGLKLVVNPDAHSTEGLDDVRWGISVARKAGATAADLVNCAPIEEFL